MTPPALYTCHKTVSVVIFFVEADLLILQKNALIYFFWEVLMHAKMFLKTPANQCLSSAVKLMLTALRMKCSSCCGWDSEIYQELE